MQLQLTTSGISVNIERLLNETADALSMDTDRDHDKVTNPASIALALNATARRLHNVAALDNAHATALRVHWKHGKAAQWATARCTAQPTATNRHAKAFAEQQLADSRKVLDEITDLVVAAAVAVTEDVAAGIALLGDIKGLTDAQVIERMYTITGVIRKKTEKLRIEVGAPLPGGSVVVAKEGTGGRAWAITDSNGSEWRINKYSELFRYPNGEVEIITPDWANYGS
ncbi:hypothetical protein Srufu_080360 (plasmid) [Streptomyces libani subsp. rufus]|nr:hypothetical protein Srufu_080360 [Streptomyces libani subsp. rufus]